MRDRQTKTQADDKPQLVKNMNEILADRLHSRKLIATTTESEWSRGWSRGPSRANDDGNTKRNVLQ